MYNIYTMNIYQTLDSLEIKYKIFEHKPVFTVEESKELEKEIPGQRNKSLFLRNKNKNNFYLILIQGDKKLDLKDLRSDLDESKLNFTSSEDLKEKLNVTPGSVSPFNLINNKDHKIVVVVDEDILVNEKVYFHPDRNSATLELSSDDFKTFLESTKNKIIYQKL
jgi:Ala-tRNA(Pro) deacylase